jgi:hypothetical protein
MSGKKGETRRMNSSTWITIILAIIAASPGIYAVWRQRRKDEAAAGKDNATASDLISQSATRLLEPLKKQIDELQEQVGVLEDKVAHQETVIHKFVVGSKKLHKQLLDAGLNPVWQPADLEAELK